MTPACVVRVRFYRRGVVVFPHDLGNGWFFRRLPILAVLLLILTHPPESAQAELLTKGEAIQLALERSPLVLASKKEWEVAQALARQTGALPDPELELEFEGLSQISGLGEFSERTIGLTQRLEFPLKWWNRRKAGRQQADAARLLAYETTKLDVILQVNIAYDRIALQKDLLGYARENLQLADDVLRKARTRFESGDVPQLEMMRAEVEAGRATSRLTAATNALTVAKAELNTVLARDPATPVAVADSLEFLPLEADIEALKQQALTQRPDLSGGGLRVAALRSRQSVAKAALVPDLRVGAFRQRIRGGGGEDDFWLVNFALEVPLWAFSRQRGEIAQTRAEVGQAAAELLALRYQVLLETETAYLNLRNAQAQVVLFQQQILPAAERTYQVASRSYDEGKATYLELLEAQRTLTDSRTERAEALFDYRAAVAALERAVAGPLVR